MHIFIPETLFGQAYIWYKKILRTMHEFSCVIGNYCDVTISILIDERIDLSMFIEDVNTSIWLWLLQTGTHWFQYPYWKYKHIDLRIYLLQYLNVNTWVWVLLNMYCKCEKNDRFVRNSRKEKNIDFEIKIALQKFTRLLSYWMKIR